jgi:MoxR-like ATPase
MNASVKKLCDAVKENVAKVIVGKDSVVDLMLITLLCGGHMLIEDVPGTGKTKLVKSFAASLGCSDSRIQFTPDLLPSDITGINYFNMKKGEFEFVPGPVFASVVLADEINRATPKTQSGLLECMEEGQATIDGKSYPLNDVFMVIATQNPVENMGVFPLPEAQLDRFLVKTVMKYPTHAENVAILERFCSTDPLTALEPVATAEDVKTAREELNAVYVHRDIMEYISSICEATRNLEGVVLGISPRGAISLMRVAKGFAALSGRSYVTPDDVKKAVLPTLPHRLTLTGAARIRKNAAEAMIRELMERVTVPTESELGWSRG